MGVLPEDRRWRPPHGVDAASRPTTLGRPAPYAEGLRFAVRDGGTEDEDERVIGAVTLGEQAAGKVKDLLTGTEESSNTKADSSSVPMLTAWHG